MYHHTARLLPKFSLRDHRDAGALWGCIVQAFPNLLALCVMPNHLHLVLPDGDEARRLPRALSGWARWKNLREGTSGGWWQPCARPEPVTDEQKQRRMLRYVMLNPCRARLVDDPLAWPWSTHRDRVGLSDTRVGPAEREPERFHAYVSADPSAAVDGTPFPQGGFGETSWFSVRDAVCSLTRSSPEAILARGRARTLAVQTAWMLGVRDRSTLAAATRLGKRQLRELTENLPVLGSKINDRGLAACLLVVGDPRFEGMPHFKPWGSESPPRHGQAPPDRRFVVYGEEP